VIAIDAKVLPFSLHNVIRKRDHFIDVRRIEVRERLEPFFKSGAHSLSHCRRRTMAHLQRLFQITKPTSRRLLVRAQAAAAFEEKT